MKRNRTLWKAAIGLGIATPVHGVLSDEPLFKMTQRPIDGGVDSKKFGKAREKTAGVSSSN